MNESLPEQGSSIDFGDPTSNVYSNDKMNKQFFETAAQAFEELTTKYFNTDYYQYETFKNWAVIKTVHDAKRRATTIVYRCKPQPSDEPYTLFGLKTELDTCAELHFKDLLANVELETLENLEYESIKRIEWLGLQSDIIHVVLKDLNFLSPGREVVLARHWHTIQGLLPHAILQHSTMKIVAYMKDSSQAIQRVGYQAGGLHQFTTEF
uniref:START domain-containing protein n=1 Tax=Plectus sambesii TaxID=2011161 RepID=A0A914VMC0_9BILA